MINKQYECCQMTIHENVYFLDYITDVKYQVSLIILVTLLSRRILLLLNIELINTSLCDGYFPGTTQ